MSKLTSVLLIILIFSDATGIPNKQLAEGEEYHLKERKLPVDPLSVTVISAGILLLIPLISSLWRNNPDYQVKVYEMKTHFRDSFATKMMSFYNRVFAKDIVNRCLCIVKTRLTNEEKEFEAYFVQLCDHMGNFILNHLPMTIKMFDMTYNIRYFQHFLLKEKLHLSKLFDDQTTEEVNRRFLELMKESIFRARGELGVGETNQHMNFRIINTFYGGFWEMMYNDLFDASYQPRKTKWYRTLTHQPYRPVRFEFLPQQAV
jgi:hypothetical protein